MSTVPTTHYVPVASLEELKTAGRLTKEVEGRTIVLFWHNDQAYALDNRCPHMGFPLHLGSLQCGILTCHWHHARFELASGGTFDPWADDVATLPVKIEDGQIWVDAHSTPTPSLEKLGKRLEDGLHQNLRLIIAKAVLALDGQGQAGYQKALQLGAILGTQHAREGWNASLTIFTAMANILPYLHPKDRPLALYHGLTHLANQVANQPTLYFPDPLPFSNAAPQTLKQWFRDFVEVRDTDAAMRVLHTAIVAGHPKSFLADMLCAATTDHIYLSGGHALDFVNKAFELLELVDSSPQILLCLVPVLTNGRRSEELSSWRHPINLVALLQTTFAELPALLRKVEPSNSPWNGQASLLDTLLADDPVAIVEALKNALRHGATGEQLAATVALAAVRRIAQFRTSNEFGDWITVLHTFTYANAVHCCMQRAPSIELLRAVFDAALSVYLDRFLNMPPAPLPSPSPNSAEPFETLLDKMDRQSQVEPVAQQITNCFTQGGTQAELLATLGYALLREDAEFHTYQMVEAGFRQFAYHINSPERLTVLVAMGRYLAAHAPTPRSGLQTYLIASRLYRGENLYSAI